MDSRSPVFSPVLMKSPKPPGRLDELLADCFKVYMVASMCDDSAEIARKFTKYCAVVHCSENLSFLMEIFKYEYYYDRFRDDNPPLLVLNLLLGRLLDLLPFPRRNRRRYLIEKTQSKSSASSNAGFEFNFDAHAGEDPWDKFMHDNVSDELLLDDRSLLDSLDNDTLLADQWKYIIDNFIQKNAPQQLNLDIDTVKHLLDLDTLPIIHKPFVLMEAKEKVVQILQENVYGSFLAHLRAENSQSTIPGSTGNANQLASSTPNQQTNSCTTTTPNGHFSPTSPTSPSSLTSSASSVPDSLKQPGASQISAPVPVSKRKTRLFPNLGSSDSDNSSDFSLSHFINNLKNKDQKDSPNPHNHHIQHPSTALSLRSAMAPHSHSIPHSSANSQCVLPVSVSQDDLLRPSTTVELTPTGSISRLHKFWKRRR